MVPINPNTGKTPRWKMALDVERCIGCHACSVACKVENNVPLARYRTKVYYWDFWRRKRSWFAILNVHGQAWHRDQGAEA